MADQHVNTKAYEGLLKDNFGQDVRYYQPREDFQKVLDDGEALYRVKVTNGDSFYVFFNSENVAVSLDPKTDEGLQVINTLLLRLHPDLPAELSGFLEVTNLVASLFNFSSGKIGDLGIELMLKSDKPLDWELDSTISYYEFIRAFEPPRITIEGDGNWEMTFLYYLDSGGLEKWKFSGTDGLLRVNKFSVESVYPPGTFRLPRGGASGAK